MDGLKRSGGGSAPQLSLNQPGCAASGMPTQARELCYTGLVLHFTSCRVGATRVTPPISRGVELVCASKGMKLATRLRRAHLQLARIRYAIT